MPEGEEEEQKIENLFQQIMKKNFPDLEKEIDNLCDAEFKSLVIRMLRELTEFSRKMKEKIKPTQCEIKENVQRTSSEGKETRIQINDLGKNKHPTGTE